MNLVITNHICGSTHGRGGTLGSAWVFHCATHIHAAIVVPWWTNGPPTTSAATKARAVFVAGRFLSCSF